MGECGCSSNDDKFTFPGPGKSFYVLTLSAACDNCDAPSGVAIEHVTPESVLYENYKRGEFINGPLEFQDWPDSKGVGIVTGMRKDEFIKALLPHLVGIDGNEMGEDGVIDEAGADVILEEMYADSIVPPRLAGQEQTA